MTLNEKIAQLRKAESLSQEALAEKINVSRQAVSRWESGTAMPDASNILQLSKLFRVSADYLLNDEYEKADNAAAFKETKSQGKELAVKIIGICVAVLGLIGNLTIYIVSRFIRVPVPYIYYVDGVKWYRWGTLTGYSYKYFVQRHSLEFLTVLFWILAIAGIVAVFVPKEKFIMLTEKVKAFVKSKLVHKKR